MLSKSGPKLKSLLENLLQNPGNLKDSAPWICTVESCTGGRIASFITGISGASQIFWGSFVVYDNSAKIGLGVSPKTLQEFGAVSRETSIELARLGLKQMQRALKATSRPLLCVSTTGIAGPDGGTAKKPVGLCHIGLALDYPGKLPLSTSIELHADGRLDRGAIQEHFTKQALEFLERHLNS